ncbi:DNA primase [Candidatus Woesearchaeota archaeon]|nr:DNA primase [Candidatus Woesearchaeota archaeon]
MAKIAQTAAKYIVHATINIEGVVDRPDVIGAIFGQTEGLLGEDLELRELQRSGRIGRIEVNVETKTGKTDGVIIIPSSLDKAETAIIGAAIEVIERIGPCNAKIRIDKIEDIRVSKRDTVVNRAKELLKNLTDGVLPDSQELCDEVSESVRVMEIVEYGKDRLPAGPTIEESDEVILVEGRADVLNLLKHGFKNVISLNGTSVPKTIVELAKKKTVTAFVDGDRGGNLIIKELSQVAEVDFVTKAPDGKEVEELAKKEIHKALRSKVSLEQALVETNNRQTTPQRRTSPQTRTTYSRSASPRQTSRTSAPPERRRIVKPRLSTNEKASFKEKLDDLIGTRGAYILDDKSNILGKVPNSELVSTIKSLSGGVYAVIFDGEIDKDLVTVAERARVKHLVAMNNKTKLNTAVNLLTSAELEA